MQKPRLIDRHGNHIESHGKTIWHAPTGSPEKTRTPSSLDVYSHYLAKGKRRSATPHVVVQAVMRSEEVRSPVLMGFNISADDAETLAASLLAAAHRSRAVAAALTAIGGAA